MAIVKEHYHEVADADLGDPPVIPTLGARVGAGVPAGAPTAAELPIAVDTTPATGGAYVWDGAAWVQVSSIP